MEWDANWVWADCTALFKVDGASQLMKTKLAWGNDISMYGKRKLCKSFHFKSNKHPNTQG